MLLLFPMRNLLTRMRRMRKSFSSIAAVVGELQFHAEIFAPQQRDDSLELVAIFTGYSDSISLDAGLCLLF